MPDYRSSALFSETEKLVLEYADAMTQTPVEVAEALFEKLGEKFSEAQLVELTATLVGKLPGAVRSCVWRRGGGV